MQKLRSFRMFQPKVGQQMAKTAGVLKAISGALALPAQFLCIPRCILC